MVVVPQSYYKILDNFFGTNMKITCCAKLWWYFWNLNLYQFFINVAFTYYSTAFIFFRFENNFRKKKLFGQQNKIFCLNLANNSTEYLKSMDLLQNKCNKYFYGINFFSETNNFFNNTIRNLNHISIPELFNLNKNDVFERKAN